MVCHRTGDRTVPSSKFLGLVILVVTLILYASGRVAVAQSPAAAVTIKDFEFVPKEIKVKVGTTVTWTNAGTTAHSATACDRPFYGGRWGAHDPVDHTYFPYEPLWCNPMTS
jgi:plastocyanin